VNMRVRNQREREVILEILGAQKPMTVADSKAVWCSMATLGHPLARADFIAHVDYLAQKGYLRQERRDAMGVTVVLLALTPAGRDLLDGLIVDPGVGHGTLHLPAD